ncbi:MAG: CHAP domain-containing protein [Candidatus Saccharimonadales bacterium]|nr:CHAP domain-containing protein [Candidatus Saccharibacteria bacterium]
MQKKVSQSGLRHLSRPAQFGLLVASSFIFATGAALPAWRQYVWAEDYQAQINALTAENDSNRAALGELEMQASSYADAITKLQQQIDALQASINANMDLQAELQKQIAAAQAEIDRQREILAEDIKAMYVDGTPSSLEMLASSDNFSDYVDKQEYRSRVQTKLQDTLKKIAELEKQLQEQKAKVEALIRDMQIQQSTMSADRAKQWELLNMNESKQAEYDALIKANNSKVAQLRAAQAAANRRLTGGTAGGVTAGDPSHGGYPAYLDNAAQDSLVDPWGMYNRECVSYTAWKVFQTYGYMPYWGGVGNANQWPGNAARAGIPTGSTPRVGSVAVWNVGYYGHVMWVEAVNADGSIWISQYNYDFNGHYSEMLVSAGMASNLTYIYFD